MSSSTDHKPRLPAASLADLGFKTPLLLAVTLVCATVPALVAWLLGASTAAVAGVAVAAFALSIAKIALTLVCVRTRLVEPLQGMTQAMDDLRMQGKAPTLVESGAPILRPLLRLFNLACKSMEQRDQLTHANLISAEVAFDRMHSVLQSLREGVVVVDQEGRVVLANRSARQVVRNENGPIEGSKLAELLGGDLGNTIEDAVERGTRAAGQVQVSDIAHDDRIFDLTIGQMQPTRPDRDFGRIVVFVDVTKHHEVNRLKDDLLSSISHELRTPLTNMCSSSEILATMDPDKDKEWRDFVRILASESQRLKTLVDDVMLYNQIDAGRTEWLREVADVNEIVAAAVEQALPAARRKGLDLRHDGSACAATVDKDRVGEVVARLLDNAVKFTLRGGCIAVRVESSDGKVHVTVADSGLGIRREDRQRVFDRFCQFGDVMTDKPKGAGLGLAICRRIVEAMGGTICCEDSPLCGVQFRFALPMQAVPVP